LLKKGNLEKSGFMTFIANTFIIKNNNTHRIGAVFYVRDRQRSTLNYLIKLFMSGVTSSIGAKHNGKMIRNYKKELAERNLPPFDYD
jgi:hypothetical protein